MENIIYRFQKQNLAEGLKKEGRQEGNKTTVAFIITKSPNSKTKKTKPAREKDHQQCGEIETLVHCC